MFDQPAFEWHGLSRKERNMTWHRNPGPADRIPDKQARNSVTVSVLNKDEVDEIEKRVKTLLFFSQTQRF